MDQERRSEKLRFVKVQERFFHYYRSACGRFTISKVHYGRCAGDAWILVDLRHKFKARCFTLGDAKRAARGELEVKWRRIVE